MKRTRRVEITLERDELYRIRRTDHLRRPWCAQCAGDVLTPEEAVVISGLSSRAIHRWAEEGRIHFEETPAGLLLVCLNSLLVGNGGPSARASTEDRM